jgi:hypothetical protein
MTETPKQHKTKEEQKQRQGKTQKKIKETLTEICLIPTELPTE